MNPDQAKAIAQQTDALLASPLLRNWVAQAHSRNVLERMQSNPADWPPYTTNLNSNLLYLAHLLFWSGLRIRDVDGFRQIADEYIRQGSEILEFVYSASDLGSPERTEQILTASLGYYISGFTARAFVLMRELDQDNQLLPEYILLRRLFLKEFIGIRQVIQQVLNNPDYLESTLADGLRS